MHVNVCESSVNCFGWMDPGLFRGTPAQRPEMQHILQPGNCQRLCLRWSFLLQYKTQYNITASALYAMQYCCVVHTSICRYHCIYDSLYAFRRQAIRKHNSSRRARAMETRNYDKYVDLQSRQANSLVQGPALA